MGTMDSEQLDEVLDAVQRKKVSLRMKRLAPKIKRARERALKRAVTPEKVKKRAVKMARSEIFRKLAQGEKSDNAFATRKNIEKRMEKMAPRIQALAKKMVKRVRELDRERKSGGSPE